MKTTFTNQCSGMEFYNRNSELEIRETKNGKLFFIGSTDERGYVSDEAADILQAEMSKEDGSLKEAMMLLSFSVIHTTDVDGEEVEIPTLHKKPTEAKLLWKK